MILGCNSCEKKFVVPDSAIGTAGRLVQCSSCGNKWKQFPPKSEVKIKNEIVADNKKIKTIKNNLKVKKKKSGPNLYSPEYLAKKHGIDIKKNNLPKKIKSKDVQSKISFGFYNYLIFLIVILIFFSRLLYFSEEIIVENFPVTKFYLDYFFESMRNIFEITKNLITYY